MTITPAAAHMDGMYRHQRRIYDATRAYYLLGRDQLIEELAAEPKSKVLEIACGTARNLLHAADRFPGATHYGVDISSEMLLTARASVAKSRHRDHIHLAFADASYFDMQALFGFQAADRVFISYALSMIPSWEAAIEEALRHVAPGGSLHIVDFGSMEQMPGPVRRALMAWLAKFDVTPRRNLETVCRAAATRHGTTCAFHKSPRGYWAKVLMQRA